MHTDTQPDVSNKSLDEETGDDTEDITEESTVFIRVTKLSAETTSANIGEDNNAPLALSEIKEEPPGRVAGKDTKDCSADIPSASHDEGTVETLTVVELGSSSSASQPSSISFDLWITSSTLN